MQPRIAALALLLTPTGAAQGEPDRILGRGDTEFARELYRAGYVDLAEGLCSAMVKAGKGTPEQLVEVRALSLDLRLDAAKDETDPRKRKDAVAAVLREKQEFIQANPGSREAQEAIENLSEVYRSLGEVLTALLEKETDPAAAAKLRKEGEEIFTRAAEALRERIAKLKELRDDPAVELRYLNAYYSLPRTFYYHSLIYPAGDIKKERLLDEAVNAFREFGLDYGEKILNFEGLVYQGLCHKQLGKPEEALADFDDAIRLRELYDKDEAGRFVIPPEAADVVSAAVLQKVLLLREQKKSAEGLAAAKDYLSAVADSLSGSRGLAVLAAQADLQFETEDLQGAGESADRLVAADPNGAWGKYGREIQGRLLGGNASAGDAGKLLRIAETLIDGGDGDRALDVCREVLEVAKGSPQEADAGAHALSLVGVVYAKRKWLPEAAAAFDAATERYPTGAEAPEALWKAVQAYIALNEKERRPFYRRRIDDRMARLAKNYPSHPRAALAQLIEAQQVSGEDPLGAARLFERVAPGSAGYEEALLGAGDGLLRHARSLLQDKKTAEAKPFLAQAEERYKKAAAEAREAAKKTLDPKAQASLSGVEFASLNALSNLYLLEEVKRQGEVLSLLEGADGRWADDPAKVAAVWGLRIQALQAQGKFEEAIELLETLVRKDADPRQVGAAAGVLARALDEQGVGLREKEPRSTAADDLWKKAARYYEMSVRAQVSGDERPNADLLDRVAFRLFVFGLHFNAVPVDQEEFVGWEGPPKAPEFWEQAARIYEAALTTSVSYRTMVLFGRTQGYLGRWREAATTLANLFDQESILTVDKTRLNNAVLAGKPELLAAYLEYGFAEFQVASAEKDLERFGRARSIFEVLASSLGGDSRRWWHAKYHQIRCLIEQGAYRDADIAVRSVERTTQDFDQGKFGYKPRFLQLKAELSKKNFRQ